MSILIKGVEMPTSCGFCVFEQETGDGCECYINGCLTEYQKRPDDCPLIPVPPHGDLIDRYDLKNKEITIDYDEWDDCFDDGLLFVADLIDNAPVIIPADPAEEGE